MVEDPTVTAKREELMRFKQAQLSSWKKKMAEVKMSVRVQKLTERKMLRETRLREKVEQQRCAKEKLRRARDLLKEAQRVQRMREKEEEKEKRRRELEQLMRRRGEERRRRKLLASLPPAGTPRDSESQTTLDEHLLS